MMFEEDDVCASFTLLLKGIQTETKVLKCVSQLRSLPPNDKLTEKIYDIELAVQNIEKNLEDFNEFLLSEMTTCETIEREIINGAEQQAKLIALLHNSLPVSLIDAVNASKAPVSNKERSATIQDRNNVTLKELEIIPKSTRGRLTLGVINGAMSALRVLTKEKTKNLLVAKKKMSRAQLKIFEDFSALKLPNHGDYIFLTESEIRATSVFEAGESSGKATVHTLRALQRIRLVRSASENTYIVE